MTNVIPFRIRPANTADQVLDDAFHEEYEELVLFGIKDGRVTIHNSETVNLTRLIGALERMKYALIKDD